MLVASTYLQNVSNTQSGHDYQTFGHIPLGRHHDSLQATHMDGDDKPSRPTPILLHIPIKLVRLSTMSNTLINRATLCLVPSIWKR